MCHVVPTEDDGASILSPRWAIGGANPPSSRVALRVHSSPGMRTNLSTPGRAIRYFLTSIVLLHCGGATVRSQDSADGGGSPSAEAGSVLGPCGSDDSCPSGSSCYWAIGSCSAVGECVVNSTGPECGAEEILCGCNGQTVTSGCGFPEGFASGPSNGSSDCYPEGPYPTPDAGVEAGSSEAGGGEAGSGDSGTGIEAGTPVGPCGANGACPTGASCYFPIGSCSAAGQCIEDLGGSSGCQVIEYVCGCGAPGSAVMTGCGFPTGYASGPAIGPGACAADAG